MASRFLIYAPIVTLCFFLSHLWAEATKERLEYAIKTIETENGDIYDCVDFYKQPAFNHPLLKNHSFHPEMRPSSRPKRTSADTYTTNSGGLMDIKLKDGSCPRGTVPIKRMNNDYLLQSRLHGQHYTKLGVNSNGDPSQNNVFFAVGQSRTDPTKAYYGLGANLSVFNPRTLPSQYTSGEIIIKGGNDAIIVGWTVNPIVYKDTQTRFFIYTVAGDAHCFNSLCGFISVRPDIPLDFVMKPVSTVGGPIYEEQFFVYQDEKNGNWWLEVGVENIILGFWPQKIFKGLFNSASYIACGGEAYGPSKLGHPQMGTGYFPFSKWKKYNSYCQNIVVVDEAYKVVYADHIDRFSNDERHYGVFRLDHRMVAYGGPNSY